jgi:CDP-glucose 4,6-dehydratase
MGFTSGALENMVSLNHLGSYYKGKKVFVTGHTGFKGSWLCAWLSSLGATVRGYALRPEYDGSLFSFLDNEGIFESVIGDVRDRERLKHSIVSFQPDFIFHLAAQPLVRRSYKIPSETFDVNVIGTANVLELMSGLPGQCTAVIITTDKVYQNKELDILYNEEDALGGHDPYSTSKACAELVTDSFRKSFFDTEKYATHKKAIASARAGNVIGGGDWSEDRIIPDILRSVIRERAVEVRNPDSVRPWQHVLEPIGGYLTLGACLVNNPARFSKAYNFGPLPEDHLTVEELVETTLGIWGSGKWNHIKTEAQHEAKLLKLDITRAARELLWRPKLNAATAINWTINWYKESAANKKQFTFSQIQTYIQK